MDFGFISMLVIVATVAGTLTREVAVEYFANVTIQEDIGVGTKPASGNTAEAPPSTTPIAPVLLSAALSPSPASTPQPTEAAADSVPAPATITIADANPAAPRQPSSDLLGLAGDAAMKRPDGTVFLPITLQRLIGLRTEITRIEDVTPSLSIPGRIVTSRDVGALVQARQGGVVEPVDAKLPAIGTRVAKNQVLVTIRPVIDVLRRGELTAKVAELENLIQMGSQRILRLQEVNFIRYRESKINAVTAEIEGYRRQLQIYRTMLEDVTEIRAQSDGIISKVGFVAGQIVEPQTTLFEIVDPSRLWVEAAAFDPSIASGGLAEARAITQEGAVLKLRFIGGGLSLQGQATPLNFEVVGAPTGLQIGRSVTVVVPRSGSQASGVRLPVTALVHNAGGETTVWQRLGAESFVSRPVTVTPLDGDNVLVTAGLSANMRVVTADPAILSQVR